MRKTVADQVRDQLSQAESINRNMMREISELRNASIELQDTLEERDRRIEQLLSNNNYYRDRVRRSFRSFIAAQLDVAERDGYIKRVRETDRANTPQNMAEDAPPDILDLRDEILHSSRRRVDEILDGVDQDTLDAVLGRTDDDFTTE